MSVTVVDTDDRSALDILVDELRDLAGVLHRQHQLLHSVWLAPRSLAVELVVLDAAGTATRDYEVPFASVMVMNPTNTTITVYPGSAAGSTAPPSGPGVTPLAPGVAMTIPLIGRTLSVWGPASASVWIAPSPVPLPPMFGAAGGSSEVGASSGPVAVAASVASVVLAAANATREAGVIYNDSTANLYVSFAATSSTAAFTIKLGAGQAYDLGNGRVYRGVISGIWDAANGHAMITEIS